jgi:hypothetical protein
VWAVTFSHNTSSVCEGFVRYRSLHHLQTDYQNFVFCFGAAAARHTERHTETDLAVAAGAAATADAEPLVALKAVTADGADASRRLIVLIFWIVVILVTATVVELETTVSTGLVVLTLILLESVQTGLTGASDGDGGSTEVAADCVLRGGL